MIFGFIFIVAIFLGFIYFKSDNHETKESIFTGSISEIDSSCAHDGVCKVLIDGRWVVVDLGGDPTPEMEKERGPRGRIFKKDGTLIGNILGNQFLGSKVEVNAKQIDEDNLTLYGNSEFYIKFIE